MNPSTKPMLDDVELPLVQVITTCEKRALVEHKLPGFEGSVFQNMGRRPTHISLVGVSAGPGARDDLARLREKFQSRQPLSFVADITVGTEVTQVRLADLRVEEVAGKPERFVFRIILEEYTEVQDADPGTGLPIDQDLLDEAQNLMDSTVDELDIGLEFATGLERYVSSFAGFLARLQQFRKDINHAGGK